MMGTTSFASQLPLPTSPSLLKSPDTPFIHRDLSWLQFNERVLSEAQSRTNPLLERLKFLAISSTNLDEFFMVRYSSHLRSIRTAFRSNNVESTNQLFQIRSTILKTVHEFVKKQSLVLGELMTELAASKIKVCLTLEAGSPEAEISKELFKKQILPYLSPPQTFTPLKLTELYNAQLGVIFGNEIWFEIPRNIPYLFTYWSESKSELFVFFLDRLLFQYLGNAFDLNLSPVVVRVTRDGDFTPDLENEDTESIPDIVLSCLRVRERGRPVRIQHLGELVNSLRNPIQKFLRLIPEQIYDAPQSLCLSGLFLIRDQLPISSSKKPHLCFPRFQSVLPEPFSHPSTLFDRLDHQDFLLHHPYDSFDAVIQWIQAACHDPDVVQIEQTVYRIDVLSDIVGALKAAARLKKVRVIIELRARFDELNNLKLAEDLRRSGVEVRFGFGNLKLHGKVTLITRKVGTKIQHYAHLSTGNYNATTARQYTDLAILTSHPEICQDVRYFFDCIWNEQVPKDFKRLVSAPTRLHKRLIAHIHGETEAAKKGRKARIIAKVNALVDESVIQQLYQASQAGVQVDLIVRGACSLVPGIPGLSENIQVISIVDRFLEHSRIYYFGDARVIYLSSADWMPRNFFSRLEIAFPVLDDEIYRYIEQFVIPIYLSDTMKSWELTAHGDWKKRKLEGIKPDADIIKILKEQKFPIRSQFLLEEKTLQKYRETLLNRRSFNDLG
jgi:polyphosphate kinase